MNLVKRILSLAAFIMEPPRPKDGPPIALSLRLEPQYQDEVPVIYFDGNKSVAEEVRILKASLEPFLANMDSMYLIIMGAVIILMQAGFGFLEAGSVRAKNTTNILIKNYADLCFGTVFHYFIWKKRNLKNCCLFWHTKMLFYQF